MHVHGDTTFTISEHHGINYTTVINAIKGYQENGRMFKLLPMHSKQFILKNRLKCKLSQKLYRKYRQRRFSVKKVGIAPSYQKPLLS